MVKEFRKPTSVNLASFAEFHNSCAFSLNAVNDKLVRHFSVFEEVFKHESSMLISDYKNLYKLLAVIGENLRDKKVAMNPLYETKNHIEIINNLLNAISLNDGTMENLNSEMETMKTKSDSLKNEILNLVSGKEWDSFQSMLKEEELLIKEIKDAEVEIAQIIESVERELKKYYHLPDSYGKKVLEFYLKDPVAASISDKNQTGIKDIMNHVENAVIEKKIIIGGKKEGRIFDRIKEIKDGSLEFLVKRYETLKNKKLKLGIRFEENEIKKIKHVLESELNGINGGMSELEGKIHELKDINGQKRDEISRMKVMLEKSVKTILNQDITITIPSIEV